MSVLGDEVLELMRRTREMTHLEQKVLIYYAARLNADDELFESAVDIAKDLGLHSSAVSRARKKLEADGWLEHADTVGRTEIFRLGDRAKGKPPTVVSLDQPRQKAS